MINQQQCKILKNCNVPVQKEKKRHSDVKQTSLWDLQCMFHAKSCTLSPSCKIILCIPFPSANACWESVAKTQRERVKEKERRSLSPSSGFRGLSVPAARIKLLQGALC